MTRPRTEDDLLEFKRLVRWLAGVTLTQADAEKELAALAAKYAPEPATPAEPKPEPDWIRWTGGKNPAPGKWVQVKFWSNFIDTEPHPSDELFWNHHRDGDRSGDIVAYRVLAQ